MAELPVDPMMSKMLLASEKCVFILRFIFIIFTFTYLLVYIFFYCLNFANPKKLKKFKFKFKRNAIFNV